MKISISLVRHIEVNHYIDCIDIDASSEEVRAHETTLFTFTEVMKDSIIRALLTYFDRPVSFWSEYKSRDSLAGWSSVPRIQPSWCCCRRSWPGWFLILRVGCLSSAISLSPRGTHSTESLLSRWALPSGLWIMAEVRASLEILPLKWDMSQKTAWFGDPGVSIR